MEIKGNKLDSISSVRKNIISWYPFENGCTILEIGENNKEITETLCQNDNKVMSTTVDNIGNINEKFDYITLIGLEDITNNIQELFNETKKLLNPNGKLLIAMDNKYSIKNLSTKEGIEKILSNDNKMYTLNEVVELLKIAGFNEQKIYYPLTDYKFTNVIFTDDEKISKSELARNIVYNDEENIKFFEENDLMDKMLEDNIEFKYFANSFFIEVFNGDYIDNEIRLVTFSNIRKNKYKIKTIVKKDFVYKYPDGQESKKHIENVKRNIDIIMDSKLKTIDSYDNEKIISKYVENDTFDKVIIKTAKTDKNQAIELIKKFKQNLVNNLEEGDKEKNVFDKYSIDYNEETIENMKFAKYGLWDLIFQNCFYIEGDFYFYDQEWMEENIPIDFILYRAIKYFTKIRKYIQIEELYEILNINEEKIKIFEELDDKIQEESRNDTVWQMQKNGKSIEELRIQKLTDNHTINLLNIELENKNREIEVLKTEYEKIKNQINVIHQSKSWKLTEPLRKIRGKLK